ncbi:MAG: PTS sugar transporter subunit IIB [Lachnospiraceae bacterium]|nr:PTS sugar transporter subunit IIB [Lachnospiraceae bacterium]
MTAWSKIYKTNRILVIDDETAGNDFLIQVMKMAAPSEYRVEIVTTEKAVEWIANDPPDKKTMVLVKGPETIRRLIELGVSVPELNVGNMGAAAGRKTVFRSLQLSKKEYDTLREIQEKGTRVYIQIFPDAKSVELDKIKY